MKTIKHSCMCPMFHKKPHPAHGRGLPTTAQDYAGPSGVQAACGCPTKHCEHYESDFDRFVKETDWSEVEKEFDEKFLDKNTPSGVATASYPNLLKFIQTIKFFLRTHLEAAYLRGLAASSSAAQDGAYQNGLIAGRKEGLKEALGLARNITFKMNVDEYLPLVERWNKTNYDVPFDDGYEASRTAIINAIEALIQARKAEITKETI